MKTLSKYLTLTVILFILGLSVANAQANFTVVWNPCELQVTNSHYVVTYFLYDNTTQSIIKSGTSPDLDADLPSGIVEIPGFECNEGNEVKAHYTLFIQVVIYDSSHMTYCQGSARSSLLTCQDLHGNLIMNVNMAQ